MKILIATIGKVKASPERDLYLSYTSRLPWKLECREFEVKLEDVEQRKHKEAEYLLAACKGYDCIIALDESGKTLSSREFATQIKQWQNQGNSSLAFIIGGSDGLHESVLKQAKLVWSFGRVTWPHMLVRGLLAEQLYRANSILTNHPYHRD